MTQHQRRRVAFLARQGRSDTDIAARVRVPESAVAAVVAALVKVGQTMAGCRCGLPRNHDGPCRSAALAARKPATFKSLLPRALVATMRRHYRSGLSAVAVSRATGVSIGTVRRYVAHWRSNDFKVRTCSCGRPARHPGGCTEHHPRSLSPRWRRYVHAAILEGSTTREIADRHALSFNSVLPHTLEARAQLVAEGRRCSCGREVGHSGVCRSLYSPSTPERGAAPIPSAIAARITAALVAGRRDEDVGAELSVSLRIVTRVRQALSPEDRRKRASAMALSDGRLFELIALALPQNLPQADRDEITSDLFFGVRAGTLDVADLRRAAVQIRRRAYFADRHGPKSLDAELFEGSSRTLGDMIEDNTAAGQIEQMEIGA